MIERACGSVSEERRRGFQQIEFKAPTRFYKTGIVFMAYLNGHQDHFTMIGGQESARSVLHLSELFRLADKAGLLADPELASRRMKTVLASRGVEA